MRFEGFEEFEGTEKMQIVAIKEVLGKTKRAKRNKACKDWFNKPYKPWGLVVLSRFDTGFSIKGKRVFLPFVKQLKQSCFTYQNISSSIVDFV
ncbi:hypothetical protein [Bacillus sp. MSP13]|uniref:hypothetical protein n=1 Tax=Bacillus sp. MSP13 TaxID=1071061 RepID=UPI0009E41C3F|nr:hypothetical protein [Bacillus sp. MSP13]